MAKRKKRKTGAAGYVEKISAQIFDRIREELEKSFKVTPSDATKKIKKVLPALKKRVKNQIREELEKSFRLTSLGEVKRGKKAKVKK